MSMTVCLEAPSQASSCKQQKADTQASTFLGAFLEHSMIVWQQQVFNVAGDEQQLRLAGHLDSSQLPNKNGQGSCNHPRVVSVTEANWIGTAVHGEMCHSYTSMHGKGLPVPQEVTVYVDFVDRPQYQHVQNIVTLNSLNRHVKIAEVYCS